MITLQKEHQNLIRRYSVLLQKDMNLIKKIDFSGEKKINSDNLAISMRYDSFSATTHEIEKGSIIFIVFLTQLTRVWE